MKLIGCDPDFKGAPATGPANQALGLEGGYDYSFVPGTGHLLQIEKPEECIAPDAGVSPQARPGVAGDWRDGAISRPGWPAPPRNVIYPARSRSSAG